MASKENDQLVRSTMPLPQFPIKLFGFLAIEWPLGNGEQLACISGLAILSSQIGHIPFQPDVPKFFRTHELIRRSLADFKSFLENRLESIGLPVEAQITGM